MNLYKKHNEYNNKLNYKISTKQFNYHLFLNDEDIQKIKNKNLFFFILNLLFLCIINNNNNDIKNEYKHQISCSGNIIDNFSHEFK